MKSRRSFVPKSDSDISVPRTLTGRIMQKKWWTNTCMSNKYQCALEKMFVERWQSKCACSPASTGHEITLMWFNCFSPQVSCMFQLCLLAFWKVRQSCWSRGQRRRQWGGGGGGTVENVPGHKQLNGLYTANYWHMQAVTELVAPAPRYLEEKTGTTFCLRHTLVSARHPTSRSGYFCLLV